MNGFLGELMVLILVLVCGLLALLFSIFAWRHKKDVHFYIGLIATAIVVIYSAINYQYILNLMVDNIVLFILHLSFIVIPTYFLIQSKIDKPVNSLDGSDASGQVSESYLDEVINAPDEEIDFEEDLDLR